jgi:hypothetical protein
LRNLVTTASCRSSLPDQAFNGALGARVGHILVLALCPWTSSSSSILLHCGMSIVDDMRAIHLSACSREICQLITPWPLWRPTAQASRYLSKQTPYPVAPPLALSNRLSLHKTRYTHLCCCGLGKTETCATTLPFKHFRSTVSVATCWASNVAIFVCCLHVIIVVSQDFLVQGA